MFSTYQGRSEVRCFNAFKQVEVESEINKIQQYFDIIANPDYRSADPVVQQTLVPQSNYVSPQTIVYKFRQLQYGHTVELSPDPAEPFDLFSTVKTQRELLMHIQSVCL